MKAVLTYHSIDDGGSVISTSPADFRRHVAWLASGAVRVVPLDGIAALPDDVDAVAITFDDGFANFATYAAPPLLDHALPVTLFVSTARVGGDNRWSGTADAGIPVLPLLAWDRLLALAARGVTLGAHGRTHRRLAGLSPAATLEQEIAGAGRELAERAGVAPSSFAYPYGSCDAASAAIVRRHYACGVSTELRVLGAADSPEMLPRLDAFYFRDVATLATWGTPAFRRRLRLRAAARDARAWVTGRVGRTA
jgi:peptidoglycan/xylan/chitin deacetylase (PgdA/CDA1 family)